MSKTIFPRLAGVACAVMLAAAALPSHAVKKGDVLLRVGAGMVDPDSGSSSSFSNVAGTEVSVDDSTNLALTIAYMLSDNLGVELVGALPFSHDIKGTGATYTALGIGGETIAETDQLPPTVLLQWYFNPQGNVRPYVGAGINYTTFFNSKITNSTAQGVAGDALDLEDSWGWAVEAGVDFDVSKSMFLNVSAWMMDIDTTASNPVLGSAEVAIDPLVFFAGLGWKF
jgi:outer membrane protein